MPSAHSLRSATISRKNFDAIPSPETVTDAGGIFDGNRMKIVQSEMPKLHPRPAPFPIDTSAMGEVPTRSRGE